MLIDRLRQRRAARRVWRWLAAREAAVAVILRERRGEPEVLLVRRASRAGDRWSGHIALPGGVRQREDADLRATALRETREELGLDLAPVELLGPLDEARALVHGGYKPMRVAPYAFVADPDPADLILSNELTEAFWFPLGRATRGELDATHWHRGRIPLPFRAWRHEGRTVWGITLGILRALV
jgi:8-oxo-dGTP pyrophosphatase MutT (NUDIX family)